MSNPYSMPGMSQPPRDLPTGTAVAALVCGILSLTLCGCFTGIPAVILGWKGMKDADRGIAGGKGMAVAGLVTGSICLAFTVLALLFYVAMFGLALAGAAANG